MYVPDQVALAIPTQGVQMNMLAAALILSATAATVPPVRSAQIIMTCESGCSTADSVQVTDAIRSGLAHNGVAMVQSDSREYPLLVTGRITVEGNVVLVAAEFTELQKVISRY